MVVGAQTEKADKEEQMKLAWLANNSYGPVSVLCLTETILTKDKVLNIFSVKNDTVENMPEFEYYDFENWILCYYYPYMTLGCQGGAYITGVLYSFTHYR